MTFLQLEYILEVARYGSLSVAARKLFVSQPALSRSIRLVEEEFGIVIFDRSSYPLSLTEAGRIFIDKGTLIHNSMENLKAELESSEQSPGELRIGLSDSGSLLNLKVLPEFHRRYPDLRLVFAEREVYQLERMLESGKLDFVLSLTPDPSDDLRVFELYHPSFYIALNRKTGFSQKMIREHPEMLDASGRQLTYPVIDPAECADTPFVLSYRDKLRTTQLQILRNYFEPEIIFEADTLSSLVSITATLECGTVVPEMYMSLLRYEELPLFFRLPIATPPWPFALSLSKTARITREGREYIRLFLTELIHAGMYDSGWAVEEIVNCKEQERTI